MLNIKYSAVFQLGHTYYSKVIYPSSNEQLFRVQTYTKCIRGVYKAEPKFVFFLDLLVGILYA